MRSKSFMAVAGLLVVLVAAVGGMLAYDSSRKETIARGVSVGGVDVGGMKVDQARKELRSQLARPLRRPIVARYKGERFTLGPKEADVSVNIGRSVQAALDRSRDGGIVSRTVRGLTGGTVSAELDVNIDYSRKAVSALVKRVGSDLDATPVDADVDISGSGISKQPSQTGLKVDTVALSRTVKRKLVSTTAKRKVTVEAKKLKPEVTTADLKDKYPSVIIVNRGSFDLKLYQDLEPVKDYTIAVGMAGLETPAGLYNIQTKEVDPTWHVPDSSWAGSLAGQDIPPGPQNPLKARWMGIYDGAGIHGTDSVGSLGTAASHGCIRMAIPDVEALFDQVDVGTPVYIG